jgi:uncharacterized membrane protein YfcA
MIALDAVTIVVAAVTVLVSAVVRGMSGFGTSLVAIPILVFFLPIHAVIPMMSMLGLVAMLLVGVRDRSHVRWEELRRLIGPTLLGVLAGVYVFRLLEAGIMQKLLGSFIVGYALYIIAAQFMRMRAKRCSERWAAPAAFIGATLDTMFGGGGGLMVVIYMHRRGYDKVEFRATLAVLWLLELIVRCGGYALSGYYETALLLLIAVTVGFMWVGQRIGERLTSAMSPPAFARVLACILFASGVSLWCK